jgi:predicted nucleotidyltransferase
MSLSGENIGGQILGFVDAELSKQQPQLIQQAARACASRFGEQALAVLFYGSCLRTGEVKDRVLDFYVVVEDYKKAYAHFGLELGNRILPPNVFYSEMETGELTLRSKYGVLSLEDFERRTGDGCLNVSVWARFSQPVALLFQKDEEVKGRIKKAVAAAILTMLNAARGYVKDAANAETLWGKAFDLTYGAELRSEKKGKGAELFALDGARYRVITPLALSELSKSPARREDFKWFLRRLNGKSVSLLRLIKAVYTFDGGIDYLAWKISRHSGIKITPTPWQRRHPLIAGLFLFAKLRRRGAFR